MSYIKMIINESTEIVKTLQSYGLRSELWDNLPMKLGYEKGETVI